MGYNKVVSVLPDDVLLINSNVLFSQLTHLHYSTTTRHQSKFKMSTDYKFEGWLGHDEKSVNGEMKWGEFEPKVSSSSFAFELCNRS